MQAWCARAIKGKHKTLLDVAAYIPDLTIYKFTMAGSRIHHAYRRLRSTIHQPLNPRYLFYSLNIKFNNMISYKSSVAIYAHQRVKSTSIN